MEIAFLFPGQGSQRLGMLAELADRFPQIVATFEEASAVLGRDLWQLAQKGPKEVLDLTENTQPVMLAADTALWRLWQSRGGPRPKFLAGHSLGEFAALVAASALSFQEAVWLVVRRAQRMQEAVPEGRGAMAALLGLSEEEVAEICRQASREGEVVAPANLNAPGQVVVSGHAEAVARAEKLAAEAGKRVVRLAVSVPSHSPLMREAAERFAEDLGQVEIRPPLLSILFNVDAEVHRDPQTIRQKLIEQLYSPVRWSATVQRMAEMGVGRFYECGPGKVLTGLNRRIVGKLPTISLEEPKAWESSG